MHIQISYMVKHTGSGFPLFTAEDIHVCTVLVRHVYDADDDAAADDDDDDDDDP